METSNEISSSIAIDRDLRFRIKSTLALLNTFHNRNGAVHSRCFGPSLANEFNAVNRNSVGRNLVSGIAFAHVHARLMAAIGMRTWRRQRPAS